MFNLMFITNNPEIALIAENSGVDRIWIDLERNGKKARQGDNTWISDHTISDISKVRQVLTKSQVLVRVNPWDANSGNEINDVVKHGADIIMLPMWKNATQVEQFYKAVNGRTHTILLLETKEAVECLDDIISMHPEEIHIGLRDLSLSYGIKSIFQLYDTEILEGIASKLRKANIKFGIGGVGKFGVGLAPGPEMILVEDYRLGASAEILSRTFCDIECLDINEINSSFKCGIKEFRKWERLAEAMPGEILQYNHTAMIHELRA